MIVKARVLPCALLLLLAYLTLSPSAIDVSDIQGVEMDERGLPFISTASGERWNIVGEKESRFFFNAKSKHIMYEDPRLNPPREILSEVDIPGATKDEESGRWIVTTPEGVEWSVHQDTESKRFYYHNSATKDTTWDDPRFPAQPASEPLKIDLNDRKRTAPAAKPMTSVDKLTVAAVATVPVVLFILGMGARIYYLHTHYPELLFPTKERKDRRRVSSGKFKPQKARGKMSQDGKGGRSANS